jgi:hypothetical protein
MSRLFPKTNGRENRNNGTQEEGSEEEGRKEKALTTFNRQRPDIGSWGLAFKEIGWGAAPS